MTFDELLEEYYNCLKEDKEFNSASLAAVDIFKENWKLSIKKHNSAIMPLIGYMKQYGVKTSADEIEKILFPYLFGDDNDT